MKKIYFLLGIALLLCSMLTSAMAQDPSPASATWALTNGGTTPGTVTTMGQVTSESQRVENLTIHSSVGYEGSQRTIRATGWVTSHTNIHPDTYTEFKISPAAGQTLNVNSITFKVGGAGGGNMRAKAYYSTNPNFNFSEELVLTNGTQIPPLGNANLPQPSATVNWVDVTANPNVTLTEGQTLYLRIYPWYHSTTSGVTGKYLLLKDLEISGVTTSAGETATAPVVTTDATVSSITFTSATVSGNVIADGGAPVTARGIAYGTTENPTTADNTMAAGEGTGEFSAELTGLTPGTTYFARAYATNSEGTSYGEQVSFATPEPLTVPAVTTAEVTSITASTAEGGGNVTDTGGAAVTARGLVWNTTGTPTTTDNITEEGSGTGVFSSQLTGLTAETTYFVRAYATNSEGTAYGQEVSFTTEAEAAPVTAPASATWPLSSATQQAVVTSGQVNAAPQHLNNMTINQYTGPEGSQRVQIAGGSWPANQTDIIPGTYIQFAVSPKPNNNLHVNTISFDMATSGGISTLKAKVFYSTDPDFGTPTELEYSTGNNNNYLGNGVVTSVDATVDVAVANGETFYLRIYPWIEDPTVRTGKYITLKDVVIAGETEATPVESSVVWANDQSFSTTGAITGAAPTYSAAMKYFGKTNQELPTTDTNEGIIAAAIQTVSQDWQAEPDPVESLWFQYAVSPKTGATLNVTNVSMYIGGWFSSNLRAAIYYSKDPTFEDRKLLVADRALVGNKLEPISVDLNETVNTGETFYVRIYPHNTQAEAWAKLVAIHNMTISGTAIGATVDPATVVTVSPATEISTTFATVGGNITSDGGSPVSDRGIAWGTAENPTTADNATAAGTGSGTFSAQLTGLTPGTTYYARAYATNDAGTSYGEQVSFATLATLDVPTVTTTAVSNVLTRTAQSGGNVTAWGGAPVTARGIVWNTTGTPTITDSKSEDGTGIGSFSSQLHSLTANTTYYVRAYATNSQGTGYGPEVTFTTQQQAPDVTKVVNKDGSGDYTTVQAAFNAVPDFYTGKWTILVKPGTYKEKLILERNKVNVILRGENPLTTILTYDDYAGKNNLGTSGSYSVAIEPDDFIAANITFQNTVKNDGTQANQQAVALRVNGDRQAYYNCRILGYQDSFYAWGGRVVGRIYMKDCYIEGSVDFIFGRDIVVFDNCTINVNRNGGMITAASTEANTRHGFVFLNSTVTADAVGFDGTAITSFHLGRPWQAAPRTVYMNTFLPATLNPAGWQSWNATPALYGEYNNSGPGASLAGRSSISRALTAAEAAEHTIANIFSKETHPAFSFDWMPENISFPVTSLAGASRNAVFNLGQNYPNPFNASTNIEFELKKASYVTLEVFDITGKKVATLAEGIKLPGVHEVTFNNTFHNGIYFYKLSADGVTATRKMVITR